MAGQFNKIVKQNYEGVSTAISIGIGESKGVCAVF